MEVGGDGGVRSGGEEEAVETEGIMGISRKEKRRSSVWVMESVESDDEKDDDEEESTEWRWLSEREYRDSGDGRRSGGERL